MIDLKSLTINSMRDYLKDLSLPKYKIENIYTNIHKNRIDNIDEITTLKKEERANLKKISYLSSIKEVAQFRSKIDNTKKYIFEFNDGELIETVFMKHLDRNTICISSQVGCRMGCIFCASTKGGLARNLTSGEMLNQIYYVEKDNNVNINNIVLMGQGEPLDNFDNVVDFLNIITSENGANKSMRKITLSTCGLVDKIYKLADLNYPLTLAISLHRTNDCARNELMPINKRYNIKSLIPFSKKFLHVPCICPRILSSTKKSTSRKYTPMSNAGFNSILISAFKRFILFLPSLSKSFFISYINLPLRSIYITLYD